MINKLKPLLLSAVLILVFTACSKNDISTDTSSESNNATDMGSDSNSVKLSNNLFDTEFSINDEIFRLPMWLNDFNAKDLFCYDDTNKMIYSEKHGNVYWTLDDIGFTGIAYNGSINAIPVKECLIQHMVITDNSLDNKNKIIFSKDIQLSVSTKSDIISAYGEPSLTEENTDYIKLVYQNENIKVSFRLDSNTNVLKAVNLDNTNFIGDFDNTINSEVPYIFDYVAPTQLGDTIDTKVFKLNEQYYSLPCPVTEFLNNGFELSDFCKDFVIEAGGMKACRFELDGKTFTTYATNFSHYATSIYNCHVTAIENTFSDSENIWVAEFSPGLQLGDNEDKVIAALKGRITKYYNEESVTYDVTESLWQDTWNYLEIYNVEVKDGIVTYIYFRTDKHPAYEE